MGGEEDAHISAEELDEVATGTTTEEKRALAATIVDARCLSLYGVFHGPRNLSQEKRQNK